MKFVGVGGQGTILATTLMSAALVDAGYDVKMSEIHGMSQRNGSVSTEIRYGEKVYSPVISKGDVDVLISFEQMEAARSVDYLKKDGILLINNHKINSMVTLNGKIKYPENIIEELSKKVTTHLVNATDLAFELGNRKVMNVIMLGALVKAMNLQDLDFNKAIKEYVKPQFIELNLKAFEIGLKQIQ